MNTAKKNKAFNSDQGKSEISFVKDAFHDGSFEIFQVSGAGHKGGMDALLLAAALPEEISGIVADLGAGTGAAGIAALNLNDKLDLLAVEKNGDLVEAFNKSLQLPGNARFSKRAKGCHADVTLSGIERLKAGLGPECVNHVIMNPPYNFESERPPQDALRAEAYMLGEGGIDAWFRTAAAITRPGGKLCMIYRTQNLGDILACTRGRYGGLEILPVHSRKDEAAKRVIVRGTRGSRAPMTIVPGFVVHEEDGSFTEQAKAIFDGRARLQFGDS